MRICRHHEAFERLAEIAERLLGGGAMDAADRAFLAETEGRDDLFPDLEVDGLAARAASRVGHGG